MISDTNPPTVPWEVRPKGEPNFDPISTGVGACARKFIIKFYTRFLLKKRSEEVDLKSDP